MAGGSKIREGMAKAVEFMAPAAALVSLSDGKVISSNEAMLRRHGGEFAAGQTVSIKPFKGKRGGVAGSRTDRRIIELSSIVRRAESDAVFELVPVSRLTALLVETGPLADQPSPPIEKSAKDDASGRSFHFSYMENAMTGARVYSHPELLKALEISNGSPECSGCEWRSLVAPGDLPFYDNALSNLRQHGGNHELRYRIRTHGGESMQVSEYLALAPAQDGKSPQIVGTVVSSGRSHEDIRAAERLLLQSRLVGGMVHDFKNLLGGIQNIIEWTVSHPDCAEELKTALGRTLAYTEQAASLISGALKVGSGKRDSKTSRVRLGDLALELEGLMRRSLPSSISLVIGIEDSVSETYAQRDILKDALLNLCVNARDAMKERGSCLQVKVYGRSVPDAAGKPQKFTCLSVKDDGCGMSEETLRDIFEAFYSTKDDGAGLGLWMVREAVRSFDGKLEVRSELGKGTEFELMFPSAAREGVESSASLNSDPNTGRIGTGRQPFRLQTPKTALIVEDEPLIRDSVAAWMESLGFKVLSCGDGREAIGIFKDGAPSIDIVIQDYILPGARGDELLEVFVSMKPGIPVIVASANPDESEMLSLKERGAFAFLPKPFRMDDLINLLEVAFVGDVQH